MTAPRTEALIAFNPVYQHTNLNPQTQAVVAAGTQLTSVTVVSTNASATAGVIPNSRATGNNGEYQLQISNKTTAWAHINWGVSGSVVAATVAASYPVAPGSVVVVTIDEEVSGVSVILDAASTGSTSVIFTRGTGL